jgi:hypothetical protein
MTDEITFIAEKKTAELVPYAQNARTHSDDQIEQIAASIKEFGFLNPIIIDEHNGIVAGHGRVLAAELLGIDSVPAVQVSGLSDAQRKAYIIADNKLALNAGWSLDMLQIELQSLSDMGGIDLELTGFTGVELDVLMGPRGANNASEEWVGMPEFDQTDKSSFRSILIHFKDTGAINDFAKLVGQNISDKTKYLWYPPDETGTVVDKVYSDGDA